jgi:Peptidase family M28
LKNFIIALVLLLGSIWVVLTFSSSAPGDSAVGRGAPATSDESEAADRLQGFVEALAQEIGPRGDHVAGSQADVERFLQRELRRLHFDATDIPLDCAGSPGKALEVMIPGRGLGRETILLAAHIDSSPGSPGADDNATGVAVLLEVLRTLSTSAVDRTVRAVFWTGGAAPTAGTEKSAAAAYGKRLRARHEKVAAALCFDSLGIYADAAGSQTIPFPFSYSFPDRGDFVAFVGDWGSKGIMDHALEQFRLYCKFPSQALSFPSMMEFVSASDDGALRDAGFPALRVTDTAQLRNPVVGTPRDLTGILDYARMARVSRGLAETVIGLGKRTTPLM